MLIRSRSTTKENSLTGNGNRIGITEGWCINEEELKAESRKGVKQRLAKVVIPLKGKIASKWTRTRALIGWRRYSDTRDARIEFLIV